MAWSRNSYRLCKQTMQYFALDHPVFSQLQQLPGIVSPLKIQQLRTQLQKCELNEAKLLHSGDCAEAFEDANEAALARKVQTGLLLRWTCIGRLSRLSGIVQASIQYS